MKTLKDKVAVVTGAGSGIGRAIALSLAGRGCHVVVADVQEAPAKTVADELRSRGVRAISARCDVSKRDDVGVLADAAYAEFGRVDVLCNNAGVSWRPYRSVMDATLADWNFIFGVNFWGVIHGLDAFLPRMRKQQGEKHIVNTASLSSLLPNEGHAPYAASKAAVLSLTESIAGELAPHGFGVTALLPGPIETNLGVNARITRGEDPKSPLPTFEPVDIKMLTRVAELGIQPVDQIGEIVCTAILENRLIVHTHKLPHDLVADRIYALYGPSTLVKPSDQAKAKMID